MKTAICVLVLDRLDATRDCLRSVCENTGVPCEIFLLDNGSQDPAIWPSLEQFAARSPLPTHVFRSEVNLGAAPGRRFLFPRCSAFDYVVSLDNDTTVEQGWLHELVDIVSGDETIGAVGSRIVQDGKIYSQGGYIRDTGDEFILFGQYDKGKPLTAPELDVCHECDWLPSGAMLVTQAALKHAQYADGYRRGWGESDFCMQIARAGFRMTNAPKSVVYHHPSRVKPTGETQSTRTRSVVAESLLLFISRWGLNPIRSWHVDEWLTGRAGLSNRVLRKFTTALQRHFAKTGALTEDAVTTCADLTCRLWKDKLPPSVLRLVRRVKRGMSRI